MENAEFQDVNQKHGDGARVRDCDKEKKEIGMGTDNELQQEMELQLGKR